VRVYLPSRLLQAITLVFVVGAAVLTWGVVIRTLREVRPVPSPGRPTAVVWADRVFQSPAELRRWLRSRGGSYESWSRAHPKAWATLEHVPVPRKPVRAARTKTPTASKTPVTAARTKTPPAVKKAAPTVKTATPSKPARRVAATSVAPARSAFAHLMIVLLACLATLCLGAAVLPASVGRYAPALGRVVVGNRPFLLAAAAAVYVGLVVGLVQG
jgi:hypothetical protein